MTEVMPIVERKSELCREIMSDLPEWFSVPEVVTDSADEAAAYPMLGCRRDGAVVGIVSLKEHAPSSAEVFVLGVRRRWHRQGIGRNLLCAAEEFARRRGMRLLTVKTLAPLDPDPPHYA